MPFWGTYSEGEAAARLKTTQNKRWGRCFMTIDLPGQKKEEKRLAAAERADRQASALLLQHRIKNLLANIRALAAQTYQSSRSLDEFYEAFEGRLQALALAQAMLGTRRDGTVNLTDLILELLLSDTAGDPDSVTMDGPDILLEPDAAQIFALVVHELIINAIKHGALSSETGHIVVRWGIEDRTTQPRFTFQWQETGVAMAPEAGAPGFGRRLIEEALPHQLGGDAVLSLSADGCNFRVTIPLDQRIRPVEPVDGK